MVSRSRTSGSHAVLVLVFVSHPKLSHGGGDQPREPASSPRARERDREAVQLRAAGLTFAAIGVQLGISDEAARKA